MKKQSHTFIMGGFALFSIYLYYLSAAPLHPTSPQLQIKDVSLINIEYEEENALNYLNKLRKGAGLIPFQSQEQLNLAAKNHANYLTNHLTFGHIEEKKYKDFTGKFASQRARLIGYPSPQVIENVSAYNKNHKESIDGLFAAIYHRLAFLDFRADTIGIGISQNKSQKAHTAFVYDMSSKALEELYENDKKITTEKLTKALNINKELNSKVVIYPFNEQKEIPPAFFDELPDPLPKHRVSGFPISISFNSFYYKKAKLLKFELYDSNEKRINETLVFDYKTDPNRRLTKLDFVLFPLKRLAWNSEYHVKFLALIDNKSVSKEWSFSTQKPNMPLHIVKDGNGVYALKIMKPHAFYFPPTSKVDLLHDISYPANVDIEFIDKNTIKLTALSYISENQRLLIGTHQLTLDIQK